MSQYKYCHFWLVSGFFFPSSRGLLLEHCFRILLLGKFLYHFPVVSLAIILYCITCHSLLVLSFCLSKGSVKVLYSVMSFYPLQFITELF